MNIVPTSLCGVLVFGSVSRRPLRPPLLRLRHLTHNSHTTFHTQSVTRNYDTFRTIFHTQPLSHTIFHTPSLTHYLSHTHTHTLSHTCSEQSLRILMWNAAYVQKTLQLNLTGEN